ncbi:MAG: DUF3006 domain-containing protein [Acidobacteria bacterium]|nr:DUF3006 domain-containing protein [Acidobacteriota bacterium]
MKVVIDRIEGDLAVMLISDYEEISLDIPLKYLPQGAKAGDYFDVTFTPDLQSRISAQDRSKELLKELTKDNDPNQTDFKL